jgi:hypothetical protein
MNASIFNFVVCLCMEETAFSRGRAREEGKIANFFNICLLALASS